MAYEGPNVASIFNVFFGFTRAIGTHSFAIQPFIISLIFTHYYKYLVSN